MSKLLITTQVFENYAWNEDGSLGTGENAYWKPKGGSDYVVKNVDINRVKEIAEVASKLVEQRNDAFIEYVIGWEVVEDDYMTQFEKDQLEFEGIVRFGPHDLTAEVSEAV